MKFLILAVFAFLVLGGTQAGDAVVGTVSKYAGLAASFTNDSVIVDIVQEGQSADVVPEADSDATPPAGSGGGTVSFPDDGGSSTGGSSVIDEVTITTTITTEEGSSDSSGGAPNSTSSEETVSAQDILNTLTGNQAITTSNSSNGSAGGIGSDSNSGAFGSGGTNISGSKTRQALLSRGITNLAFPAKPVSEVGNASADRLSYSRADLALIISGEMVRNPNIDDVFYTTNAITVTYKAQGRLLFALPIPYTAKLDLRFDESTAKKRVRITFPWFKFFMWTGVSKSGLRDTIDTVITAAPAGEEYDRATLIFQAVATILNDTQGTASGSIRTVQ